MTDIEIPFEKNRHGWYRFFEILPGLLSWLLLFMPLILSLINVTLAIFFVLAYLLIYFTRTIGYDVRALSGYRTMRRYMRLDWQGLVADIEAARATEQVIERPSWHFANLARYQARKEVLRPSELFHAVIIATVNESREVLEPTIQSILAAEYDPKKIILIFAYEARAGAETAERVQQLLNLYGHRFKHTLAVEHPANLPNETIGKGGNITCAGRQLKLYLEAASIDPKKVLVTTLDADNRPDKRYFAYLSYMFCIVPNPLKCSFQPLPMFTNNIWDAPTLMRVIATGNNLYYIVLTQRPHLERNFSAHAQSMHALIEMDFWSVRTIVEDGHHFWRSYFHFNGDYRVYPLSIPIYQDAVLAKGYLKTLKAQFIQLRRWTYGASDIAYIAHQGLFKSNKISRFDIWAKLLRALEGHVTWASGAPLITFAAFIPAFFHPQSFAANQLPFIVSRIQQFGLIGLIVSLFVCLRTLPPRPSRYRRHRSLLMLVQWIFLPVTGICYGSAAAFYSQTRLMFRKYLSQFDVTEKAVITTTGDKVS
ncbi:MAG TPA: glycosyltransferase family 2 protein [Candidatus Dormibacteraeota bacterium]|nr:glycosyltransferase family 2 protein [Candidatus Dormibacteraeota bacterium]